MRDSYMRSLIAHTVVLGVACAAACGFAVDIFAKMTTSLVVAACGFAVVTIASLRYDAEKWRVPDGCGAANVRLRREVGVALGAGASAATALLSFDAALAPSLRAAMICQSVLMAAAAVNDFARFRLPLPLTIVGALMALTIALMRDEPLLRIGASAALAVALMVAYRRVVRADLGGGDEFALCWIAAAAPFQGVLAICLGQALLTLAVKIFDRRRRVRRVPIGGAWLAAAAWLLPLLAAWGAA